MPLEVNEIGVNMRVRANESSEPEKSRSESRREEFRDLNREELVDDCVRRVLQILRTQGGR